MFEPAEDLAARRRRENPPELQKPEPVISSHDRYLMHANPPIVIETEDVEARKRSEATDVHLQAMKKVLAAPPAVGTQAGTVLPFKKSSPPPPASPRPPAQQPLRPAAKMSGDELKKLRKRSPAEFAAQLSANIAARMAVRR